MKKIKCIKNKTDEARRLVKQMFRINCTRNDKQTVSKIAKGVETACTLK